MSETRFSLPGTETVTIAGTAIDKLVRRGDSDAALLYLYILRSRGNCDISAAASALGKTQDDIMASMRALSKIGLLLSDDVQKPAGLQSDETPQYTVHDIKEVVDKTPAFRELVSEVQTQLGKPLASDDILKLFSIYDHIGLPAEVILILVNYCIKEVQRNTPGRFPTMRYIEKAAYTWESRGIMSLERAEHYLLELEEHRKDTNVIRRRLGIADRALSPSESQYLESWLSLGFSPDAIAIAYDRTVAKTGKLAWQYMNSIINSWHAKGLHTPEEIEARDGGRSAKASGLPREEKTQSQDDYQRMKRILDRMKEDNDVT